MTAEPEAPEQEAQGLTREEAESLVNGLLDGMLGKDCSHCGDRLGHGMDCPVCMLFTDPQRTLVVAKCMELYRKAVDMLRDADAAEYARRLYDAWGNAEGALSAAKERTAPLEVAVRAAVAGERKAQDRLRKAADYAERCGEAHRRAKRDHASPEVQTEALTKAQNSVTVAQGERAAAEGAATERQQAEANLAAHRAEIARLEDAAVAARKAADNPPARVELGAMTALTAPPLMLLGDSKLTKDDKVMLAGQVRMLADLSGVTADLKAEGRREGREALQQEIQDQRALVQRMRDGNIVAIASPGVPRP